MAVVLGILLVAVVPKFSQTSERLRVEHLTFELTQLLRYARERAVTQGTTIVWVWNPQARRAQLYAVAATESSPTSLRLDERTAKSAPLPDAAILSLERLRDDGSELNSCPIGVPADTECLRFFPDGTSESATLTLRVREFAYTVSVDGTSGQVVPSAGASAR